MESPGRRKGPRIIEGGRPETPRKGVRHHTSRNYIRLMLRMALSGIAGPRSGPGLRARARALATGASQVRLAPTNGRKDLQLVALVRLECMLAEQCSNPI
jgi:hypothetical protein